MSRSISFLGKKTRMLRKEILTMAYEGNSAHISSSLCIVDILTVLYWDIMRSRPKNPSWKARDRFILSKGHAASALYAALAHRGFFPKKLLRSYGKEGTVLAGHPEPYCLPGVELATGSLGHGLAVGAGMALAAKMDKKNFRVFVVLSDGECDEGSTWEAALFSSHQSLDNLVAFVDYNKFQAFGRTNEVLNLEPLALKWVSFGWEVKEIDGHNIGQLKDTLNSLPFCKGKPSIIICHTIAGKGVSFIEDRLEWNYKNLDNEMYRKAIKEIDGVKRGKQDGNSGRITG